MWFVQSGMDYVIDELLFINLQYVQVLLLISHGLNLYFYLLNYIMPLQKPFLVKLLKSQSNKQLPD